MKATILILAILISADICVYGQGSVDIVYGNVGYEKQSGVEVIFTFGYPTIEVMKRDDEAIVTAGIPPVIIAGQTVSTENHIPLQGITVFPNPVGDVLNVQRENEDKVYMIRLFDAKGVVHKSTRWNQGQSALQIKTHTLIAGEYFLSISRKEDGATEFFKIVKVE